jgi:His-Xaa-Ser system radical SAM maturase HxsB
LPFDFRCDLAQRDAVGEGLHRYRAIGVIDRDVTLITNDQGEYALLTPDEFAALEEGRPGLSTARRIELQALGFLGPSSAGLDRFEQAAQATRKRHVLDGPSLHILVVTLRCDHSCQYCQVSRANVGDSSFDMTSEMVGAAITRVFESPSPHLTIEFQGGEPALRFDLVRQAVALAEARNAQEGRALSFTMVSTLHHLSVDQLEFCREHGIHVSTSIDGPQDLHNRQRPVPTRDSWQRTVEALERARSMLGHDGVSALPTVTRAALKDPVALIEAYRALGFGSIFLRPVSPYGFARKTRAAIGYPMSDFVAFYDQALDYILDLNRRGVPFVESYASILLRHIMTPFGSGYVDLRSPAGAGLSVLAYNYDGYVYPSDEARMTAETGDHRFRLGRISDSFDQLMSSDAMRWLMTGAVAEELPGCRDCAFVPFCGADPVYHAAIQRDPVGRRETSEFCARHKGLFDLLFRRIADGDPEDMKTFLAWAFGKPRASVATVGGLEG